ncbi:M14 family murein peptide amidase A [Peredibacter starrii]|uniref:M14 family murein peptide amidase A n=1 Tax=Peredibacter starrii TaxID=28202 RepID=A0AAX4HSI4_9BACT|nr:M14 family murein peptide amidase A [Peredibacter starrii]WPU66325.1 M14 family murein peptide amidase A [Peredibacter starrii]
MIFSELDSGESVEGHPIPVFKTDIKASKYLYLIGGVHGDEVEGVYVLKELFQWLKLEHSLKDLPMIVIPILNVDGYKNQTRVNAHSVDLNRNLPTKDWSGVFKEARYNPGAKALSEPENQFLVKLMDKYKPGFILSFHTWKPILNYNGDCKDVAEYLHGFNKYEMASDIGYPTPGSLGTFAVEKYQSPVLTFECPELKKHRDSLKEIWKENEEGLKGFFQTDLIKQKLS